jgi:glycosyltransferase involved in cell wall biosynthesis
MKIPILYISYDGMTDTLGQSQVLPYICGLTKEGYSFTLISCEKKDKYQSNRKIIQDICHENAIDWRPLMYHKSPPVLSTIWDVYQIHKLAMYLHHHKSFQIVHCRGYISALIGIAMKRNYATKFLFDMRGLWADEKVDAGAWNLSNPIFRRIYHFFKNKERQFFREADHTVSLTHRGKAEIRSWDYMREVPDTITVIPCCADTNLFDFHAVSEESKANWREKLVILPNQFILTYLGSIGTWYMLDEMLDFFIELKKEYGSAKFLFITHDEHARIRKTAEKKGVLRDIIIQPGQRTEVPVLISLSSLSVFFIRSTYSKICSSPTKQGEIMGLGVPIVCNTGVGDTDTIVHQYHSGWSVEDFSPTAYKNAIAQFKKSTLDAETIRKGSLDYFSLQKGVESYHAIYEKLVRE